jgi:hypothetical protein
MAAKEEREFLAGPSSEVKISIKPFEAGAIRSGGSGGFGIEELKTVGWMLLNVVSSIGIVATNKW